MTAWTFWKEEPPPRNTVVYAKWNFSKPETIVLTCKRGCCVGVDSDMSMVNPTFWRPFDGDQEAERNRIINTPGIP